MFDFFDTDVGEQPMDVSASTRKFQQSIVVSQDPNKSGVLSFLSQAEEEMQAQPQSQSPQTITPETRDYR